VRLLFLPFLLFLFLVMDAIVVVGVVPLLVVALATSAGGCGLTQ